MNAERVRNFCLKLTKNAANQEYVPQLIPSGSSPEQTILKRIKVLAIKILK